MSQAQLLDELMGVDRNATAKQQATTRNKRSKRLNDRNLCPLYLSCGFCISSMDLAIPKHSKHFKAQSSEGNIVIDKNGKIQKQPGPKQLASASQSNPNDVPLPPQPHGGQDGANAANVTGANTTVNNKLMPHNSARVMHEALHGNYSTEQRKTIAETNIDPVPRIREFDRSVRWDKDLERLMMGCKLDHDMGLQKEFSLKNNELDDAIKTRKLENIVRKISAWIAPGLIFFFFFFFFFQLRI